MANSGANRKIWHRETGNSRDPLAHSIAEVVAVEPADIDSKDIGYSLDRIVLDSQRESRSRQSLAI